MTAARTILIIDSDRDVAEGIAIRLRGAGFRTVWTTTAAAGRRAVFGNCPDLIVLDLELPHGAARKLMIALRKNRRTRGIPVIGCFTDHAVSWRRMLFGPRNCIRKPFEAYSLHEAVAKSLEAVSKPRGEGDSPHLLRRLRKWGQSPAVLRLNSSTPRSQPVRIDMPEVKHVLLIDDDQDIVAGACVRLRAAGYDVVSVNDGEQGVAAAESMHPDAIVLDVQMPRMSGMTALNRLKASVSTCNIPVVMLSASLSEQTAALDAGARFYLRKPYQAQALLAALDAAVGASETTETRLVETEECRA